MNIQEKIEEISNYLFDEFSLLESFSWVQYKDDNENLAVACDDFTINEESYWGENSIWKMDINNYLRNKFDEFNTEDLHVLYGSNIKVVITRNETITTPYFIA